MIAGGKVCSRQLSFLRFEPCAGLTFRDERNFRVPRQNEASRAVDATRAC